MNYKFLQETELFAGISAEEFDALKYCISFEEKKYKKDEIIFLNGQKIKNLGLIIDGQVILERYDYWGNKNIVQVIEQGDIFGESFAAIEGEEIPFNVITMTDCHILFIENSELIHMCHKGCNFHNKFIANLFKILARKNIALSSKIIHTSEKSIRARVMNYLSDMAFSKKKESFSIPFNRQQMADYLLVDRTALSKELSRMQEEGLIKFWKNEFSLLNKPAH